MTVFIVSNIDYAARSTEYMGAVLPVSWYRGTWFFGGAHPPLLESSLGVGRRWGGNLQGARVFLALVFAGQ